MQPLANGINDRKKQLKLLGCFLALLLPLFWVSLLTWQETNPPYVRTLISENSTVMMLAMVSSLAILALAFCLFRGHEWAWWGVAILFVLLPVLVMFIAIIPIGSGLAVCLFLKVLYESSPRNTFVPATLPRDIDELAAAMNIHWEEQPLWHLVSLAKQGKVDEAVKTLRSTHHMTWDQADQSIRRWKDDELGLKLYLLKLHAQSLPVGKELMVGSVSLPDHDQA